MFVRDALYVVRYVLHGVRYILQWTLEFGLWFSDSLTLGGSLLGDNLVSSQTITTR